LCIKDKAVHDFVDAYPSPARLRIVRMNGGYDEHPKLQSGKHSR